MDDPELARVQKYLQNKFGNPNIRLRERMQSDGSVEVYLGEEFIGVIYKDEEAVSYTHLTLPTILRV